MAVYPNEILNRIREEVDIVDVISEHVLLKKAGANFRGLCPFHEEKTPSFNVHPGKRIFHCFGCGQGGDVFKFLMLRQNMTFPEAVRHLAGKAGIALPDAGEAAPAAKAEERARRDLREINRLAADYFRETLDSQVGTGARKYLAERGISRESVESFGLGLAPAGWQNLLEHLARRKVSPPRAAGLVKPRATGEGYYDVFRGRIVFPIHAPDGSVVGFGGRVFEGGEDEGAPKYLNSPDTALFKKNQILYGFLQARDGIRNSRTALLVEGYFDVIALHQHGLPNAVATMGTALTADHVAQLRRGGLCERLVLCFDPDAAGEGAAKRGGTLLLEKYQQAALPEKWRGGREMTTLIGLGGGGGPDWNRMTLQALALPSGEDADSFVRTRGPEAFRELLGRAENLIDYLLNRIVSACPPDAPIERRMKTLQEAASVLAGQREAIRREYVRILSERLRIDDDLAGRALRQAGKRSESVRATLRTRALAEAVPAAEKLLVRLLLTSPELAGALDVPLELFSNARMRRLADAALRSAAGDGQPVQNAIALLPDPDDQAAVTELTVGDAEAEHPEREARDCIARILESDLKRRKADWQARLDAAKEQGNPETIQALLAEGEALRKEKVRLFQKLAKPEGIMEASSPP